MKTNQQGDAGGGGWLEAITEEVVGGVFEEVGAWMAEAAGELIGGILSGL